MREIKTDGQSSARPYSSCGSRICRTSCFPRGVGNEGRRHSGAQPRGDERSCTRQDIAGTTHTPNDMQMTACIRARCVRQQRPSTGFACCAWESSLRCAEHGQHVAGAVRSLLQLLVRTLLRGQGTSVCVRGQISNSVQHELGGVSRLAATRHERVHVQRVPSPRLARVLRCCQCDQ